MIGLLASGAGIALGRFPAAVLAIAGLSALANLEIADITALDGIDTARLALALSCAAAAALVATLAAEARRASVGVRLVAGFGAALAVGALVWAADAPALSASSLLSAALLAIPLAPSAAKSNSLRCWTFAFWTLFGCVLGFASVMLFVLGVSAIVEMIRYLFGVGIGSRVYQHVYAMALTFVGPVFALGRIPREFDDEADESRPGRLLAGPKILSDWIGAPLTLVMIALLHAYAAKVVLAWEIPASRLGWIISTFIVVVLAQRFLAEPFRARRGAATALFRRVWVAGLVVPTLLLGYAIWLRVGGEGWTAQRYFLALLAATSALIALLQPVPKLRGDVRAILAVPAALLLLASFGPWGMSQTVGRSQTALIRAEFADATGQIRTNALGEQERDRLRSRIGALSDAGALSSLASMLPSGSLPTSTAESTLEREILQALGLDYGRAPGSAVRNFVADRSAAFDVSGFDTLYTSLATGSSGAARALASLRGDVLHLSVGSVSDGLRLDGLAAKLPTAGSNDDTAEPLIVDGTTMGGRTVRLRILSATIEGDVARELAFDVALRRDDWSR